MNILIIQREEAVYHQLVSKLEKLGHSALVVPDIEVATKEIAKNYFPVVIFDPGVQLGFRGAVHSLRQSSRGYSYIIACGSNIEISDALKNGANIALNKPLVMTEVEHVMESAGRIFRLIQLIGNADQDFPSSGGVIAKSAFNQLFISAVNRAVRYEELSHVLFIRIDNIKQIEMHHGAYTAQKASAKLARFLAETHRLSDILAQIDDAEYALMMYGGGKSHQPMEAANRFAEALQAQSNFIEDIAQDVSFKIGLVSLPMGTQEISISITDTAK